MNMNAVSERKDEHAYYNICIFQMIIRTNTYVHMLAHFSLPSPSNKRRDRSLTELEIGIGRADVIEGTHDAFHDQRHSCRMTPCDNICIYVHIRTYYIRVTSNKRTHTFTGGYLEMYTHVYTCTLYTWYSTLLRCENLSMLTPVRCHRTLTLRSTAVIISCSWRGKVIHVGKIHRSAIMHVHGREYSVADTRTCGFKGQININ